MIPGLLDLEPHLKKLVVIDSNPEELVRKIIAVLDKEIGDINTKAIPEDWFIDGHLDDHHNHKG